MMDLMPGRHSVLWKPPPAEPCRTPRTYPCGKLALDPPIKSRAGSDRGRGAANPRREAAEPAAPSGDPGTQPIRPASPAAGPARLSRLAIHLSRYCTTDQTTCQAKSGQNPPRFPAHRHMPPDMGLPTNQPSIRLLHLSS